MIRKRREASGYGTYSKRKEEMAGDADGSKLLTMPRNSVGQVTKRTKQIAHGVDNELLADQDLIEQIVQEELKREAETNDMDTDQWVHVYEEIRAEMLSKLAEELLENCELDGTNHEREDEKANLHKAAIYFNSANTFVCALCHANDVHKLT